MDNKEIYVKTDINKTHVPDKLYSFMIQVPHMLYELLNCKSGDCVSVEVFDDVGIQHEDGNKEAIQLKSALSDRNPVSNKAVDLWKTMYNWLISVEAGELDSSKVKFILFINVNKEGNIVNSFHSSKKYEDAVVAWENAKKLFYDDIGAIKEINKECKKYIEYFFLDEKKELACKIIENFELKKCIENYSTVVRKEFDKSNIPEDIIEPIYRGIIGWININVIKIVEDGKPIVISYEEYQKQLGILYREYNQKYSLMTYSVEPSEQERKGELQKQRKYIQQLEIIECDYEEKMEAINDYLRAAIDRTKWAENAYISEQSLWLYEEKLKRSWKVQKRMIMLEKKDATAEEQGKWIYYKCQDKKIEMDTVNVPDFFQNGCYHALSDKLEVGWHPQYLIKMGEM